MPAEYRPYGDGMTKEELETRHAMSLVQGRQEALLENLAQLSGDHERRIRLLERVVGYGSGAVGMGLFFLKALKVI